MDGLVGATGRDTDLLRALFRAHEHERAVVAAELHEDVGQALKALLLGLQRLEGEAAGAGEVQRLKRLAGETLEVVRRIALELRPSTLDELGLSTALRAAARAAEAKGGLTVTVHSDLPVPPPRPAGGAPEVELALFRAAQEALTNVVRHARAATASVVVTGGPASWSLVVEDDGVGFDASEKAEPARRGLTCARAWLVALGGELHIESSLGGGTSVYGRVPVG